MKKKSNLLDLSVALVIISSIALRKLKLLLYLIQIVFIIFGIKNFFKKTHKKFCLYRILYLLFVIASILWTYSIQSILRVLPSIVQIIVISVIMCGYIDSENKVDKIINYFVIAGFVLVISIILFTPLSEWKYIMSYSSKAYVDVSSGAGRLGRSIGMHPNGLGQALVVCILCVTYKYICNKNKKLLLLDILLFFMMLFVKSRSSLLEALFGIFLLFFLSKKYPAKQLIYGVVGIVLGGLCFYSFLHVNALYKLVGYRLEGMLGIFGNNTADASTMTRIEFVKIGWKIFKINPLLGVGMNNFSNIAYSNYSIWAKVYAHNNYIEILSDLGLIGFFLYYWLYIRAFFILNNILKYYKKNDTNNSYLKTVFLYVSLIVLAIMNISHITYETECVQYIGMLIIVGTTILNNKLLNEKKEKFQKI